jgi:hypothetical protein
MVTIVETAYTCHICNGPLELMEDKHNVWLGCKRCVRYVKRDKIVMMRRFIDRRKRKFYWRQMLDELYYIYTRRYS